MWIYPSLIIFHEHTSSACSYCWLFIYSNVACRLEANYMS